MERVNQVFDLYKFGAGDEVLSAAVAAFLDGIERRHGAPV